MNEETSAPVNAGHGTPSPLKFLAIALVSAVILEVVYGILVAHFAGQGHEALHGQWGDSFAPLTGMFSALALGVAFWSVVVQTRELSAQRASLDLQREEMSLSRRALEAQLDEMKLSKAVLDEQAKELGEQRRQMTAQAEALRQQAHAAGAANSIAVRKLLVEIIASRLEMEASATQIDVAGKPSKASDLREVHRSLEDEMLASLRLAAGAIGIEVPLKIEDGKELRDAQRVATFAKAMNSARDEEVDDLDEPRGIDPYEGMSRRRRLDEI